MIRLTTDNPKSNIESAHNLFRIKDGTTVCNLTDDGHEITLYDLMRHCGEVLNCRIAYDNGTDDDISEFLTDNLFDGCDSSEGILAHFYTAAWAFSEIREKLKAYEDSGLTPNEVKQLKKENGKSNKTLKLMAKDFYDSSDDDMHTGPDGLIDDYKQAINARIKADNDVINSILETSNYKILLDMACKKIYDEIGCPAEMSNPPSWPECDGEAEKCGNDHEPWECWEKLFLQRFREENK